MKRRTTFGTQAGSAYEKLHEWILVGKLAPGEKIFAQRVADEIGMSRIPVRDALRQLAGEALVVPGNSGKWEVVSFSPSYCRGISTVREALEKHSARLCAERATPQDIERLRVLAERCVSTVWRPRVMEDVEVERDFHVGVAEATQCSQLRDEIERCVTPMMIAYLRFRIPRRPLVKPQARQSHDLIVDAIKNGDPDRAEQLMAAHVHRSMEELIQYAQEENGARREPIATGVQAHSEGTDAEEE